MKRKVAIWLRVSTEDQKLDSQDDAVRKYVAARDWNVVSQFLEEGVGGAAQYRKVVDEVLDGARRKRFDTVVIFRGDRSFRTAGKGCLFIEELISTGCAFVSVEDGIDTSTPAARAHGEDGHADGRMGAQGHPRSHSRWDRCGA
jgi:site-specific DNA recombinase